MKPALIDLDEIEKLIELHGFENLRPESQFTVEVLEYVTKQCSQPALVELVKKAWDGGATWGLTPEWKEPEQSLEQFLTQNNLKDETTHKQG